MPSDRKARRVDEMLADRVFENPDVRALLDEMSVAELTYQYGEPERRTYYATPQRYAYRRDAEPRAKWDVGDERPIMANDDPAVIQALGRCAASRIRWEGKPPSLTSHKTCTWCDVPLDELLKACDWATHESRYVTSDIVFWRNHDRTNTYVRELRSSVYENPVWRDFWALPREERERRITEALA